MGHVIVLPGFAAFVGEEAAAVVPAKTKARPVLQQDWSPEPGLNQRHPVYKTGALPTELSGPAHSLATGQLAFTPQGLDEIAAAVARKLGSQTHAECKRWPALMMLRVAQEYNGIGESKLKQWITELKLPNSSPDSTPRIMRKDLDAMMKRCRS